MIVRNAVIFSKTLGLFVHFVVWKNQTLSLPVFRLQNWHEGLRVLDATKAAHQKN